jgi:hypothetical protein
MAPNMNNQNINHQMGIKNLHNVIADMRVRWPNHSWANPYSVNNDNFWIVRIERGNRTMTVELDIDYNAESVIACVLDNHGFERREFTPLLNAFMNAFDY